MNLRAKSVLLIRPKSFGCNLETLGSNKFQHSSAISNAQDLAIEEFDRLHLMLQRAQVQVDVFEDLPGLNCPDAVFPNNWFSTHESGEIFLYPMMAENRRRERRQDIVDLLKKRPGFKRLIDLSAAESKGKFLEGTGSIVFDHKLRIAFACRSQRTDEALVNEVCEQIGYQHFVFDAFDSQGEQIYHTNVMMSVGEKLAIVCLESIEDKSSKPLVDALSAGGRKILELSVYQMQNFAGNALELESKAGPLWALSSRAESSLSASQKEMLGRIVHSDLSTIESLGGGSLRCMLAEIFI